MLIFLIFWFLIGLICSFILKVTDYLKYDLNYFEITIRDLIDIFFMSFFGFVNLFLTFSIMYAKFKVLDKVIYIRRKKND